MDTEATSHMTSTHGNLSSYFNLSKNNSIIVGNSYSVPIHGFGNANLSPSHPPLALSNVLHAPKLIKNLIYVRKFTTDNHVSVEFDPFGFSVKDFQTVMVLMRCESQGQLYPITNTATNKNQFPSEFAALSTSVWHDRLGHPGASILDSLRKNKILIVLLLQSQIQFFVIHVLLVNILKCHLLIQITLLLCHSIYYTVMCGHLPY